MDVDDDTVRRDERCEAVSQISEGILVLNIEGLPVQRIDQLDRSQASMPVHEGGHEDVLHTAEHRETTRRFFDGALRPIRRDHAPSGHRATQQAIFNGVTLEDKIGAPIPARANDQKIALLHVEEMDEACLARNELVHDRQTMVCRLQGIGHEVERVNTLEHSRHELIARDPARRRSPRG